MKKLRGIGLLIITLTYIAAAGTGIGVFWAANALPLWLAVLLADVAATLIVYAVSLIVGNATVYDAYWSVQPMVIVPLLIAFTGTLTLGSIFLLVLVELWGLRLTVNWIYTFKNLSVQDWRYDNIKKATGTAFPLASLMGIQMMPTLVVFACQVPIIAFLEGGGDMSAWAITGIVITICGILLELVSDLQKHSFRARGGKGVVNVGLWKTGRHPNYLGEISLWWGIYVFVVLSNPALWWTFFGAFANTILFIFASIPMAEKQSALRHEAAWDEYKERTRLFI